ncbi:hypothetical protein Tco_0895849 [Tanacetum coccineum]|uniref:Uncharacterized protein n=1 Tax=Tanacetum coccineum TaxID=301880 RepID=A0ABQ5CH86_9ASTR
MMYYQIIRADGISKNYKIFSDMLDDFDRQDMVDLHRWPCFMESEEFLKKKTGRNLNFNWQKAPRNQGNRNGDVPRRIVLVETPANALVVQDGIAVYEEDIAFLKYDVKVRDNSITELKNQLAKALREKDDLKLKLEKFEIPPPYTGNLDALRPDLYFVKFGTKRHKDVRTSAPIIKSGVCSEQSSSRAAVSNSTARYVNTAASTPIVNGAKLSSNVFHKSYSSVKRTIFQRTTPKNSDFKEKVNTAKVNNVTTARTKTVVSAVQGHKENAAKFFARLIEEFGFALHRESRVDSVDRRLTVRKEAIEVYKFHLKRALDRMKSQADKHRTDIEYVFWDWVFLKNFKEMQRRSVAHRESTNLYEQDAMMVNPFVNLDKRMSKRGNVAAVFVLVKWTNRLIQYMESVKKLIDERAKHKQEYNSWVNERQMQTTEDKVDSSKALDASLVDTESSGTALKEQDTSSRSGNDAHADDADIRPIYDEEPMAEVQTTAEINIFATGQQHTEQPEFNNEGKVDQNVEQCHDTCPLPAKLTDNQTTELSNQSLESENIRLKKTVA